MAIVPIRPTRTEVSLPTQRNLGGGPAVWRIVVFDGFQAHARAAAEVRTHVSISTEGDRVLTTLLLTDIVASTERIAEVGDVRWLDLLEAHDAMVSRHVQQFRGRVVTVTGDGVLAMFDTPVRAIRCACAIRDGGAQLGIAIRAGVHTGEVEVRRDLVGGIAIHIVARVASLAEVAEVLVSRTVADLVAGSGLRFADRGNHALKGVTGAWQIFAVD